MLKISKEFTNLLINYALLSFANRIFQFIVLFFLWLSLKQSFIITIIILIETIFTFFSGFLLNKLDEKLKTTTILNITFIFKFITILLLATLIYYDTYWWLWTLPLGISALFDNFMSPIVYGKIGEYIDTKESIKHNSLVSIIDNCALFISPVIGSLLLSFSKNEVELLLTLISLIFLICLYLCKGNIAFLNSDKVDMTNTKSDKINFQWLIKNKLISYILIHFMLLNLMLIPLLNIIFPSYIVVDNNASSSYLAYFEVMFSTGLFLMSALSLTIKSSVSYLKASIILPFVFCALGLIVIAISPNLLIGGLGSLIIGLSLSMLRIGNNSYFQLKLSPDIQRQFFAIRASLLSSVSPISVVLIGGILNILTGTITLLLLSLILIFLSISLYLSLNKSQTS